MTLEPFTTPAPYKVTITHPQYRTVTVLSQPAVRGEGDSEQRGILRNGDQFTAELDFRQNGDVWARITECKINPLVEGYYVALRYGGKVFARYELVGDTIYTHVKSDFEVSGISRPTRQKGRGLPPKALESDYLAGKYASGPNRFVGGLPMTVTISGPKATIVDEEYLDWLISLQPEMPSQELLTNLQGLFKYDRAFNNFQSPGFHILDGKVSAKAKFKMAPLMTGDTDVLVLGSPTRRWGQMMRPIEIIDTAQNYKRFNPVDHPWLFFKPVNSVRKPIFVNGIFTGKYEEWHVEPFHWFRGLTVLPIHGRGTSVGYVADSWV